MVENDLSALVHLVHKATLGDLYYYHPILQMKTEA